MQLRDYLFTKIENDNDFNPVYVNNDYSSPFLDKVKETSPNRVLNVGIAEQAMVSVAAGIRKSGFDSLCYSISTFLFSRANEQIKINFLSQKIPFFFVSMGPGFDYPEDGPSHHCIEENTITFTYPNTFIFNPLTKNCIDKHFPKYEQINNNNIVFSLLRKPLKKEANIVLNENFESFNSGYIYSSKSPKSIIICHGHTASICLDNFSKISEKNVSIVILTNLKAKLPIKVLDNLNKIIIWSESLIYSGLHSFYKNQLNDEFDFDNVINIGVKPDNLIPYYGNRSMQESYYKYGIDSLMEEL